MVAGPSAAFSNRSAVSFLDHACGWGHDYRRRVSCVPARKRPSSWTRSSASCCQSRLGQSRAAALLGLDVQHWRRSGTGSSHCDDASPDLNLDPADAWVLLLEGLEERRIDEQLVFQRHPLPQPLQELLAWASSRAPAPAIPQRERPPATANCEDLRETRGRRRGSGNCGRAVPSTDSRSPESYWITELITMASKDSGAMSENSSAIRASSGGV